MIEYKNGGTDAAEAIKSVFNLKENTVQAARFGFLGAYIFSIQLIYRRYTSFDLRPYVYIACALTMISGIVFNFVAFGFLNSLDPGSSGDSGGLTGVISPILSFSLGYFPYLAIRWFETVGYTALGMRKYRSEALSLKLIDGISQFHETRLRDQQIDNIENLASTSIEELLVDTAFNASEIIGWIDQATLYLYLEINDIDNFRQGGIRNFSDFQDYWGPYFQVYHIFGNPTMKLIESLRHEDENMMKSFSGLTEEELTVKRNKLIEQWKNENLQVEEILNNNGNDLLSEITEQRQNRALQLKTTPEHLDALYLSTKSGPNVSYIKHYWAILGRIGNLNHNKKIEDLNK